MSKRIHINECQQRLIMEYYGIPNGIEAFADEIIDGIEGRLDLDNVTFNSFILPFNGLPYDMVRIYPTNSNVRASYGIPHDGGICVIFVNPRNYIERMGSDESFKSTLVHELTHMIEDVNRRRHGIGSLGDEIVSKGHMKAFDNVINKGMLRKGSSNYAISQIERDVNKVMYYGIPFERNARNASLFKSLKDFFYGKNPSYDDVMEYIMNSREYYLYDVFMIAANRLLSLSDESAKNEALGIIRNCSNYRFRNWNHFSKWLKWCKYRYEKKWKSIIPKMINYIIHS